MTKYIQDRLMKLVNRDVVTLEELQLIGLTYEYDNLVDLCKSNGFDVGATELAHALEEMF